MKHILAFLSIAASFETYAMEEAPDASTVKRHYNFLSSFPLEGKTIYIFGCGHGDQNKCGQSGDHGDHSHKDAICFDNNQKSGADYIIDLTKEFIPEEVRHKADIVYFEYLTPPVIYHRQTFTNARLCLKEGGMIMWDCYSYLPRPHHYEKNKYYEYIKTNIVIKTIDTLNDSKFNGLFNLDPAKNNIIKQPGFDRFYFSYVDNPFNSRRDSKIFHLCFEDTKNPKDSISDSLQKKPINPNLEGLKRMVEQTKMADRCIIKSQKAQDLTECLRINEPLQDVTPKINDTATIQIQEENHKKSPIVITPTNINLDELFPAYVVDNFRYFVQEKDYSDNSLRIYLRNSHMSLESQHERIIASVRSRFTLENTNNIQIHENHKKSPIITRQTNISSQFNNLKISNPKTTNERQEAEAINSPKTNAVPIINNVDVPTLFQEVIRVSKNNEIQYGITMTWAELIKQLSIDPDSPCFGHAQELLEYNKMF